MPEHTPVPTPSRAVYGFAMFLAFRMFFVLYLIWAVIPEEWFRLIGITCLPQRYWAVSIPIFLLNVLAIFAFCIYPSLGLFMTPNASDLRTIMDKTSKPQKTLSSVVSPQTVINDCCCSDKETCYKNTFVKIRGDFVQKSIPPLQNLNMWEVSDLLHAK